ncbi:MAG: LPS export ABC transporter periplasmic protein LptC [Bacteroidota bacterium]
MRSTKIQDCADKEVLFVRIFILVLWTVILACEQRKDLVDQVLYEGPLSSMDSISTLLSDSGNIVMHMKADRQNNYENGDQEWPGGFFLESYDSDGLVTTMFRADSVYYSKMERLYHATGNVIVRNLENGDELKTEELFWDPDEDLFYTEKFVTIKSDDEVHSGEGMEASQDFSSYEILKPNGTFTLEDDPSNPGPRDIPLVEQ